MEAGYFFDLKKLKPQTVCPGGDRTVVAKEQMSALEGISLAHLQLQKGTVQEPLWHPNAHKVGYCVEGSLLVTLLGQGIRETFSIEAGDLFFVPKGHFHILANNTEKQTSIVFALSHQQPDQLTLFQAVRSLSGSAFGATFHIPAQFFEALKISTRESLVNSCATQGMAGATESRFKFSVAGSGTVVQTEGGYLKAATKSNLPALQDLGVLTFGLKEKGIVEPHWHTNAGELIYIIKGKTRISIMSPDGEHKVAEVEGGGGAFAPASHFHSIENIGSDPVEVIAFFNTADPDYIGLGQAMSACSPEVLSSVFNLPLDQFKSFNPPTGPLVIASSVPHTERAYAYR
jgi:oxalate decarboxylase